jgi:hypothetical protein
MNVTPDDLLKIIGMKEAELWVLRNQIAQLQVQQMIPPEPPADPLPHAANSKGD